MTALAAAIDTATKWLSEWGSVVSANTVVEPHTGWRYVVVKLERGYYIERIR